MVVAPVAAIPTKSPLPSANPWNIVWGLCQDVQKQITDLTTKVNSIPAGQACWDLNNNNICDIASEDKTSDNLCTIADCQGPKGEKGDTGADGAQGIQGEQGPPGDSSADVTELRQDLDVVTQDISELQTDVDKIHTYNQNQDVWIDSMATEEELDSRVSELQTKIDEIQPNSDLKLKIINGWATEGDSVPLPTGYIISECSIMLSPKFIDYHTTGESSDVTHFARAVPMVADQVNPYWAIHATTTIDYGSEICDCQTHYIPPLVIWKECFTCPNFKVVNDVVEYTVLCQHGMEKTVLTPT